MMRKLLAVAAAAGLMTISGAAFSGGSWTADVLLLNADSGTGTLLVAWGGQGIFLQDTDQTVHLPGLFAHRDPAIPPDPCHGFLQEYNGTLSAFHAGQATRTALLMSIVHLAQANCSADVTADTTDGSLVRFQPHE